MNEGKILFWNDKYDKEEDLYNKGEEEKLRKNFSKTSM